VVVGVVEVDLVLAMAAPRPRVCHASNETVWLLVGSYQKATKTLLAAKMAVSWGNLVGATGFDPVTPRL